MRSIRASSSGVFTTRRATISPERQRSAAAVRTPSGAPPDPITACTPVPATLAPIPAERALFYQDVFQKIGAGEAFPLPIVTRDDAHLPANLESIERATGVFMTGRWIS